MGLQSRKLCFFIDTGIAPIALLYVVDRKMLGACDQDTTLELANINLSMEKLERIN